jgi:hypothetical protein
VSGAKLLRAADVFCETFGRQCLEVFVSSSGATWFVDEGMSPPKNVRTVSIPDCAGSYRSVGDALRCEVGAARKKQSPASEQCKKFEGDELGGLRAEMCGRADR